MLANEAMADLSIQMQVKRTLGFDQQADAIKLGIEALQFFKGAQSAAGGYHYLRLTSETEEGKGKHLSISI